MVKGDKVMGIIFPNMHDEAISELTKLRTMASVPFGGRYRMIDFTLSELVGAGIDEVAMVVKRNYVSLMDHLGSGREYDLARKRGGLKIFPPFGEAGTRAYKGKIEALNNIIGVIESSRCDTVVLSDSGIVSAIDYNDVFNQHVETGAQITAIYKKEVIGECSERDNIVFQVGEDKRITGVYINEQPGVNANNGMWAYVIDKQWLLETIKDCIKKGLTNFEKDVLQRGMKDVAFYGYEYKGYLKRISSLKCYFDANLDLINKDSLKQLFSVHPVYTKVRDDAPVRYAIGSEAKNIIAADGCSIEGYVENCVLFRGVKIGKGSIVRNCVLMQDTVVGEGVVLENVICDKNVTITDDKKLIGDESHPVFVGKRATV